jgi:hypothetical protein
MNTPPLIRLTATHIRDRLDMLRASGTVRLDRDETEALSASLDGLSAESVDLFGSRTDPGSRGGDIDLLVLTAAPALQAARQVATRFFARCEEKVDVVVIDPTLMTPAQQAFIDSLRRVRIA